MKLADGQTVLRVPPHYIQLAAALGLNSQIEAANVIASAATTTTDFENLIEMHRKHIQSPNLMHSVGHHNDENIHNNPTSLDAQNSHNLNKPIISAANHNNNTWDSYQVKTENSISSKPMVIDHQPLQPPAPQHHHHHHSITTMEVDAKQQRGIIDIMDVDDVHQHPTHDNSSPPLVTTPIKVPSSIPTTIPSCTSPPLLRPSDRMCNNSFIESGKLKEQNGFKSSANYSFELHLKENNNNNNNNMRLQQQQQLYEQNQNNQNFLNQNCDPAGQQLDENMWRPW